MFSSSFIRDFPDPGRKSLGRPVASGQAIEAQNAKRTRYSLVTTGFSGSIPA
jgi:hypothetical protein